jgi:hypothetical protein
LPESDVTCHGAVYFLMLYKVQATVVQVGQVRGSGLTNVEVAPKVIYFMGVYETVKMGSLNVLGLWRVNKPIGAGQCFF